MLSGIKIIESVTNGDITICPFNKDNVNSVSYDMEIDNEIIVYEKGTCLDTHKQCPGKKIIIPEEGLTLIPGNLYLGKTKERVCSNKFIPCVSGRSSFARLGIQVHQTAFFANIGHDFNWVLEITATVPVTIHRGDKISQLYFEEVYGDNTITYNGKYEKDNIKSFIPD